jgi:predicted Rossmann-fold nucleotide-binding protein
MTWRQLERHAKPIGLLNLEDYWSPLINLLTHTINQGFADPHIRDDLIVDGDPKALIEKIDAVV